jgi:FKBP-type peptidyl-prolyl cis-trans isomerase
MNKRVLVAAGVIMGVSVVAAGGFFWHNARHASKKASAKQTASSNYVSQAIPLGQDEAPAADPNSLSVGSGNGTGQLNDNKTSSAGNSSKSNSSSSTLDPSTFAQYDKYKDATSAYYVDITPGTGASLDAGKTGIVLYKGWLTNGTLFDQSRTNSDGKLQAFSFKLGDHQVIPGWEQGMYGMKKGGTRLLIVPPAVGYGSQGQGSIPPNSVLVFAVQLYDVQ